MLATMPDRMRDAAAAVAIERGVIGLAWLDGAFRPCARQGPLTDWLDDPTVHGDVPAPLVGYEDALARLRDDPNGSLLVPNVALRQADRPPRKFDLAVFWLADDERYLLVLTRASPQSVLEGELRAEIRRASDELARANRDLGEFAYVLSHDLRAPLRALRQTVERVAMQLGDALPDGLGDEVSRVRQLTRRMGAMMSGLLEYAHIGRKAEMTASVDTGRLVDDIVASLAARPGLSIARSGRWPVLATLCEPLDLVLRNLIENAVKHHCGPLGRIDIRAQECGEFLCIDVEDDGPGIDPSFHAAIFEPFRTVPGGTSEESSGIGLALVKKTVDQIGGRIAVASEPSLRPGACFRVQWPKQVPA